MKSENTDNYMVLRVKALSKNESFARSVAAAFCVELNPTLGEINDIKTAVSEAVTNCVVHAYDGKDGEIELAAVTRGGAVHIRVCDRGAGIADIEKARRPFFTTRPEQERSGMGFTVMESFMDTLNVYNNPGGGVTVEMSKKIGRKRPPEGYVRA